MGSTEKARMVMAAMPDRMLAHLNQTGSLRDVDTSLVSVGCGPYLVQSPLQAGQGRACMLAESFCLPRG